MACWKRGRFAVTVFAVELVFLILFGIFAEYRYDVEVETRWFYPMFQNVHVMMFIGFGFLMTFLKKYGYSALSINFLIAALVLQWHILFKGLMHFSPGHYGISVGLTDLITADFTAAAVLISFGAVIGKTSPLQLVVMALLEVPIFAANEYIAVKFQASDIGGSMVVHVFGAYYGLAVAKTIYKVSQSHHENESSSYQSDIFSMIGAIFLWLYWPSFNSAIATGEEQQVRAIINTYLALASCVLVTFAMSSIFDRHARFNMVHIQNATLAGGVAVGTSANFMIQPWGAILIGCLAAVLSTTGFEYLQPMLEKKLRLHDSCGVHNLHGMPGVLAAVIAIIAVSFANVERYGHELGEMFPAMANTTDGARTSAQQAGYQAATLGVTIAMSLVGGLITGLVLRLVPGLDQPDEHYYYSDAKHFLVEEGMEFLSSKASSDADAQEVKETEEKI